RSPINDLEISLLLSQALTEQIHDRQLFMKGIDVSFFYEGYSEYTIDDL
ncbi:cell filamentation protein Fic, partial [Enterococcus faecium]